jgi:hypothetical protein
MASATSGNTRCSTLQTSEKGPAALPHHDLHRNNITRMIVIDTGIEIDIEFEIEITNSAARTIHPHTPPWQEPSGCDIVVIC